MLLVVIVYELVNLVRNKFSHAIEWDFKLSLGLVFFHDSNQVWDGLKYLRKLSRNCGTITN